VPLDGKPITPADYKLAMAKGLPGRGTLFASAKPAAKPDTEAVATAEPPVVAADPEAPMPKPILASYTPEPVTDNPAFINAAINPTAAQAAPVPERKHFVFASAGGDLPRPKPLLGEQSEQSFPLFRSAEVVSAPEVDDDHPEESSYVPFEIAGLMTSTSITYNHLVAHLIRPEQKNLSYLFEGMDHPLAATFRKTSGYQGLAAAQTFSGRAVRSVYAELAPSAPAQLAQLDR
jgi:hypothetical protein